MNSEILQLNSFMKLKVHCEKATEIDHLRFYYEVNKFVDRFKLEPLKNAPKVAAQLRKWYSEN